MKSFGKFLAIAGIISAVLTFTSMELFIFAWINNWGPTVAWAIRIAAIVIGGILFFLGNSRR